MRYGRYHMSKNKDQNLEDTQQLRKDEIEDALDQKVLLIVSLILSVSQ